MVDDRSAAAIEVRGLVKRYGDLVAVDGLDFSVPRGSCLGLLGPNGAGKTTTIEILEGLLDPDAGEVAVLGAGWADGGKFIRQRIGVQLQETRFPDKITVAEMLRAFHSFYDDPKEIEGVLALVGLGEKRDARTIQLSGGQRQRLALGCALISNPEILFLDEPTTGLDPQARRRVWEIVEDFKSRGGTVLLTTHYMEEAERLSDEVLIVDHGKIVARGSPDAVIDSLGAESIISFSLEDGGDAGDLSQLPGVMSIHPDMGRTRLSVRHARETLPALMDRLRERELAFSDLHLHRPTLEDVFVSLTGRHLRDE